MNSKHLGLVRRRIRDRLGRVTHRWVRPKEPRRRPAQQPPRRNTRNANLTAGPPSCPPRTPPPQFGDCVETGRPLEYDRGFWHRGSIWVPRERARALRRALDGGTPGTPIDPERLRVDVDGFSLIDGTHYPELEVSLLWPAPRVYVGPAAYTEEEPQLGEFPPPLTNHIEGKS